MRDTEYHQGLCFTLSPGDIEHLERVFLCHANLGESASPGERFFQVSPLKRPAALCCLVVGLLFPCPVRAVEIDMVCDFAYQWLCEYDPNFNSPWLLQDDLNYTALDGYKGFTLWDLTIDGIVNLTDFAEYTARPKLINSDVEKARNFIDSDLAKYSTYKDFSSQSDLRTNLGILSEPAFRKLKGSGVGENTILVYLGKTWTKKLWMIRVAIATLNAEKKGEVDRSAVETIPTIDQSNIFRKEVQKHKIPKLIQKKFG